MVLWSNLEAIMDDRGLTTTALAEQVGCTRANLSMIRAGKREPMISTALTIAKALDVDVSKIWSISSRRKR